jgi:TRAP transporter TAXI family solute receptor
MKKTYVLVLAVVLVVIAVAVAVLLGLIAPSKPTTPTVATTPATVTPIYSFKMPTGSAVGSLYIVGQALSAIVSKYNPNIIMVAIPGGGSISNARLVGKGDVPISLSGAIFVHYAYYGLAPFFKNESYPKLRVVAPIHPNFVGFIVRADSGIRTIYELAGKRIAVAEPGSGDNALAVLLLQEAGLWDKVVPLNVGEPDSWNLLKAGQVDAVIMFTALPNPSLYEFSMTCPITFAEIPDDLANKIQSKYPFLSRAIMPKGTYNGVDRDIQLLKVPMLIIANADAPEDLVYNIVKTYWTRFDEVKAMAAFLQYVDRTNPLAGISIPLHKGAYKFWVEIGIKVPDALKPPELK